jgi:hypothetical protein
MGYIYIGKSDTDKHFKIGRAENLENRRKAHRTASHSFRYYMELETCDPSKAETFLKRCLESKRV